MMSSEPEVVSASVLLLSLTAHYLTTRYILRPLHAHFFPKTHVRLLSSPTPDAFFAIAMGFLLTITSTPFCIHALLTASPSSGTICATTRGTLWLAELAPLAAAAPFYLYHHVFSIFTLAFLLAARVPLYPAIYAIFSGLALEVLVDSVYLMRVHGVRKVWVERANAWQYLLLRGPSVVFAAGWLVVGEGTELETWSWVGCWTGLAIYAGFCTVCARRIGRRVGWFEDVKRLE
ncbi:hypothetical protein EDC01DRAFT_650612 [Geopyxis carbonaria]|nr:hypothetical protein EDC01DRAFT_650612 [Geopyxis carbonaria]